MSFNNFPGRDTFASTSVPLPGPPSFGDTPPPVSCSIPYNENISGGESPAPSGFKISLPPVTQQNSTPLQQQYSGQSAAPMGGLSINLNSFTSTNSGKRANLTVEEYSEKSLVVRGDGVKDYDLTLREINGKPNPRLKGGYGYIFSKRNEDKIHSVISEINSGQRSPDDPNAIEQAKTRRKQEYQVRQEMATAPDDGMQTLVYKVHRPREKQTAVISMNSGASYNYTVVSLSGRAGNVDTVTMSSQNDPTSPQIRAVVCNGDWQIWGMNDPHTISFQ